MYQDDEFKAKIAAHQAAGMHARQGYTTCTYEIEGPKTIITMRDLYNERQRIQREKMGHLSIMEVLLNAFTEFNAKHDEEFSACFETQEDKKGGPLTHLYILHRLHERLLRANSEVLVLDSTYRTRCLSSTSSA
jgi:hypothetical protein